MEPRPAPQAAPRQLDALLAPSYASRLAQQFFTHSAHAPLSILILEWLISASGYFAGPDGYVLIAPALAQAAWLAHDERKRLGWIAAGELLVSTSALAGQMPEGAELRQIEVKGKRAPISVYALPCSTHPSRK